jgi:hypothetical protein
MLSAQRQRRIVAARRPRLRRPSGATRVSSVVDVVSACGVAACVVTLTAVASWRWDGPKSGVAAGDVPAAKAVEALRRHLRRLSKSRGGAARGLPGKPPVLRSSRYARWSS